MKKLLIALPLIAGCVTAKPVTMPSGNPGYFINCSGGTKGDCYKKAGDLCPSGYEVADQESENDVVINPFFIGTTQKKGILIECK